MPDTRETDIMMKSEKGQGERGVFGFFRKKRCEEQTILPVSEAEVLYFIDSIVNYNRSMLSIMATVNDRLGALIQQAGDLMPNLTRSLQGIKDGQDNVRNDITELKSLIESDADKQETLNKLSALEGNFQGIANLATSLGQVADEAKAIADEYKNTSETTPTEPTEPTEPTTPTEPTEPTDEEGEGETEEE